MILDVYTGDDIKLPENSDRVLLPTIFLEQIMETFGDTLPHPMIFALRKVDSSSHDQNANLEAEHNPEMVHVGVREFTSPSNSCIVLPQAIASRLSFPSKVFVQLKPNVPKATLMRICPVHVYASISSYKHFLESVLSRSYTTVTAGDKIVLDHDGLRYEMLVESVNESDNITACVVDTNVALDVAPSLEEQARLVKQVQESDLLNNIVNVTSSVQTTVKPGLSGESCRIYRLPAGKQIVLESTDLTNVDMVASTDEFVAPDRFEFCTMDQDLSQVQQRFKFIDANLHCLYVLIIAWQNEATVTLSFCEMDNNDDTEPCSHCNRNIPSSLIVIHRETCARHTVRCDCGASFRHNVPTHHWHCPRCQFQCDLLIAQQKHINLYHGGPYTCTLCSDHSEITYSLHLDLSQQHRQTLCPGRPHQCQFCQLIVPRGRDTGTSAITGLLGHEEECGNKTQDCDECGRSVRMRDMALHLKVHQRARADYAQKLKERYAICTNSECCYVAELTTQELYTGLCQRCYAALYVPGNGGGQAGFYRRLERRYILQMRSGCGQPWCSNEYCGLSASLEVRGKSMAQIMEIWKVLKLQTEYHFCVSEEVAELKNYIAAFQLDPLINDNGLAALDPVLMAYGATHFKGSGGSGDDDSGSAGYHRLGSWLSLIST